MFNIRRVDLNLLPVFEAVYEERSLSRAAARLAMTQSAVSHQMKALETEYGSRRKKDDAEGGAKEEKVDPEARAEIDRIR